MNYKDLVEYYEKLESTSKRLEKTFLVSQLLKETPEEDTEIILRLVRGKVFPDWDERKLGIADRLIIKALNTSTGISTKKIEQEWKKRGDLGDVAQEFCKKKTQSTLFSKSITTKKVFENLQKLATMEGQGTIDRKIQLIAELLSNASPKGAKYVVRTTLGDLRVGIGDGTLRDAIAWAFLTNPNYDEKEKKINPEDREEYKKIIETIQNAFNKSNDFSIVAMAARKGLKEISKVPLQLGKPIKVMLAQKAKDIKEGFERVGKPAEIEYKYDGFRMIIHKDEDNATIYTRRLENVTKQFPEVVKAIKEHVNAKQCILDGEAVGYDKKTQKYLPFQNISQRIRRKYNIDAMARDYPVELNVFDIVLFEKQNLLDKPFRKRREILEKIVKPKLKLIVLAEKTVTENEKEAEKFYKKSLAMGNEGIMMKNLDGVYKPGSRVGFMIKVKPVMETLDLVIVGAEWGEGKRKGWLTSFNIACRDEDNNILAIGKVGTGIKELEQEGGVTFDELTKLLKPLITKEKGKTVKTKPEIVIEVEYEEIQKSPTYSSGYALRFPRLVRIREDRGVADISTIDEVEDLYYEQKK